MMLAWSLPAFAWITIETDDPNINFEIDEKSISKRGTVVKFSEKLRYIQPEQADPVSGKIIHEKRVYRIVNCANKTQSILQGALYGENLSFIESVTFAESKVSMQVIPKGTLAEAEFDLVCRLAELTPR